MIYSADFFWSFMVKLNETCRILKVVILFFTKFIGFKQENDKKT